jgi:large subunit ribosomal protein L20
MARVKRGVISKRRHNKILGLNKGYRGTKSRLIQVATESMLHAGNYAFHGRKRKKRDFRRLWIIRINEGVRESGHTYGTFINALNTKNIKIDRKILSYLVTNDQNAFKAVVETAFKK